MQETSLYLVPTPIGNLEDITLRALRILKEVNYILSEDTRTSGKLLKHYGIDTKQHSYHAHNEHKSVTGFIKRMHDGEQFALITDAGTPAISDPGFLIVKECVAQGLKIECLPGATAFVPALVKSGLPNDRFLFEGFLPHKKGRQTKLQQVLDEDRTVILYESPHRLMKALVQMKDLGSGERIVSVSRELTKIHEETITNTVNNVIEYYENHPIKGEIVLIVAGKSYKIQNEKNS